MSTLDNIMAGRNTMMTKNFLLQAIHLGPARMTFLVVTICSDRASSTRFDLESKKLSETCPNQARPTKDTLPGMLLTSQVLIPKSTASF